MWGIAVRSLTTSKLIKSESSSSSSQISALSDILTPTLLPTLKPFLVTLSVSDFLFSFFFFLGKQSDFNWVWEFTKSDHHSNLLRIMTFPSFLFFKFHILGPHWQTLTWNLIEKSRSGRHRKRLEVVLS